MTLYSVEATTTFDFTSMMPPGLPGASSVSGVEMLRFSFQLDLFQAALNGISTPVVTIYSAPGTPAIFCLGRGIDGARSLDGHLIKMRYWPQTIDFPALKGMTE